MGAVQVTQEVSPVPDVTMPDGALGHFQHAWSRFGEWTGNF